MKFYFQQTWKQEVWDYNERVKGEDASLPLADHDILIKRRKQELKHAQDVKELYERKLERVNDLFVELNAWKLQLEESERTLNKRERQLNIQGSKEAFTLINEIAGIMRAYPIWSAGKISLAQDRPTDSSYLFSLANVIRVIMMINNARLLGITIIINVARINIIFREQ